MVKLISRQGSIPDSYRINLALCDYKNREKGLKLLGVLRGPVEQRPGLFTIVSVLVSQCAG